MLKICPPLIFIFLSVAAYSQCSLTVERFKETDNFVINVNNPVGSKVNLLIKNHENKTLWQESVMFLEKMKKTLFLGSLQPGDYKIEIVNDQESKTSDIQIRGTDKTVHPENGKTLIVGFSKGKTDTNVLDIIVQNKLNKGVTLKLYREKKMLTEENLGDGELIKRVIKLAGMEKGDYLVKVGTKENIYQYKFSN
jgi:hypothetical protein